MLPRPDEDAPDPMTTVAEIIHRNANLRSFALEVDYCRRIGADIYKETPVAPLLLPKSFRRLRHLYLEGRLSFDDGRWANWDGCIDWGKLRTLQVVQIPLIVEVLSHLQSSLPNLRTLRLRAYQNRADSYERLPLLDRYACCVVKSFLLVTPVEELDLVGLSRDLSVQDMVQGSGVALRKLRIHFDAEVFPWRNGPDPMPGLHLGLTAFVDAENLRLLLTLCPALEHLGLDIEEQCDFIVVSIRFPLRLSPVSNRDP